MVTFWTVEPSAAFTFVIKRFFLNSFSTRRIIVLGLKDSFVGFRWKLRDPWEQKSQSFLLIFPSQNRGNSGRNHFSRLPTSCSWKVNSNHRTLKEVFQKDATKIRQQKESRGFSSGIFRDPSGRIWPDFSHSIDEVVILAKGQVEIKVQGQMYRPVIGEEIFIPTQAILTVRNFVTVPNVWYYGYRVT